MPGRVQRETDVKREVEMSAMDEWEPSSMPSKMTVRIATPGAGCGPRRGGDFSPVRLYVQMSRYGATIGMQAAISTTIVVVVCCTGNAA